MLCLFGLGALPTWAHSEAVLPAYSVGMVLAVTRSPRQEGMYVERFTPEQCR